MKGGYTADLEPRNRMPASWCDIGGISLQALAEMVTAIAAGLESGQLVAR
jgi:hypothetical protein